MRGKKRRMRKSRLNIRKKGGWKWKAVWKGECAVRDVATGRWEPGMAWRKMPVAAAPSAKAEIDVWSPAKEAFYG
jgi:hypothetical protein